jgi:Ca2+-binding EF-hand superfamily protein
MCTKIRGFHVLVFLSLAMPVMAQETPPPGPGMAMKQFNVEAFVKQVDKDKDGSMSKEEWKAAGLVDLPFTFCDASKDGILSAKEMADCRLPEAMDTDKDGVLLVDEMIEFDKSMASAPKKKYEATSPYVEGGETGMDFIRVLDEDGDGKVTHAEWEKNKNATVYKDKHWPEYNKNMDEYLTVDEAPQKP